VRAVKDVGFTIGRGEALGLVGESGSGKSTVGRAVLGLVRAQAGRVLFDGQSVLDQPRARLRALRRRMQMIFQDPGGSLNPRMRAGELVGEPLLVHRLARGEDLRRSASAMLERCGLPADSVRRYPHEFSGGQRQRIAIARALVLRPALVICDEPTSSLDVSIQSQILNLLRDLQRDFGLSYLFISHDLAVVSHLCDRIAVMKEGRIVECGDRDGIVGRPRHPYTQALLAAARLHGP
jgi:ABC-type microcin C transport system duplicated ATPase subunit YejF